MQKCMRGVKPRPIEYQIMYRHHRLRERQVSITLEVTLKLINSGWKARCPYESHKLDQTGSIPVPATRNPAGQTGDNSAVTAERTGCLEANPWGLSECGSKVDRLLWEQD